MRAHGWFVTHSVRPGSAAAVRRMRGFSKPAKYTTQSKLYNAGAPDAVDQPVTLSNVPRVVRLYCPSLSVRADTVADGIAAHYEQPVR
jgi:hypothetical protein